MIRRSCNRTKRLGKFATWLPQSVTHVDNPKLRQRPSQQSCTATTHALRSIDNVRRTMVTKRTITSHGIGGKTRVEVEDPNVV